MSGPSDPTDPAVAPSPPPDPERLADFLRRLDFAEAELQPAPAPGTVAPPLEPDITDLVPTAGNHPAETAQYRTVVLTDIPAHGEPVTFRPLNEPVKVDDTELELYTRPGEGVIITSQQTWAARGVTLGRLLHSLALAPGESTRIAVVDWTRQDAGASSDTAQQKDDTTAATDDKRDVADAANSSAKQTGEGSSITSSKSHSSSRGFSGGLAGFAWGLGGSVSSSDNDTMVTTVARSASAKEAAVTTVQNLSARTKQEASALRTRQATVIKEANQIEGAKASTRVVTNYNHMHAMSVQYYEVVQSYDVRTFPLRIDRCVFVPMAVITFTPELLRRFRGVLASAAPQEWVERIAAGGATATAVTQTRMSSPPRATTGTAAVTADGFAIDSPAGSPTLSQIAAASDGTVCGVTTGGKAVRWDPNGPTWAELPAVPNGAAVAAIAVGRVDQIWVAAAQDKAVYRLQDGVFVQDMRSFMNVLACCQDGSVWGIGSSDNHTYRMDPDGWHTFGGGAGSYITAANRNKVWCIGSNSAYIHPGAADGNEWRGPYRDNAKPMKMIAAASDTTLWAITTDNELYVRDADDTPFHRPSFASHPEVAKLLWVAPVSAEEVWGIKADGRPVRISRPRSFTAFGEVREDADPSTLEVWSDDDVVRGIRLTLAGTAGQSISRGDTGSGLRRDWYAFDRANPPTSVGVDTSTVEGGSVRRIVITTGSTEVVLGPDPEGRTSAGIPIPLAGATICGLFGELGRNSQGSFVAALGFSVRGEAAPDGVLRHLNGDRDHYSQAVWANLDEITLSRILASYTYTPSEPAPDGSAGDTPAPANLPLGACVDPKPVAITGNYLAFRWNYPTETARLGWLERSQLREGDGPDSQHAVVAVPSAGVFAEAVLARANAAEKIDLTRFWNWKDSPIPILPPEISSVGLDSRARDLDLTSHGLDPALAQLQQLRALPDPSGMNAITKTMVTRLFDDMSKASENASVALQGLKEAAAAEKAAGGRSVDVYKAALEHYQTTLPMLLEAAEKLLPMIAPELAAAGALGGAFGSGSAPRKGLSPDSSASGVADTVANLGRSLTAGDGSSFVENLLRSSGGGSPNGLPGKNISETGGLLNIAAGNRNRRNGTPRDGAATGDVPIERLAAEIVRDIGIPALRAALEQDPTIADLPSEQISELVSKAIVDNLRNTSIGGR